MAIEKKLERTSSIFNLELLLLLTFMLLTFMLLLLLKLNEMFIYSVSREGGSAPQTPRPHSGIHHCATSSMRTEMLPEAIVESKGRVPLGGLPSSSNIFDP